MILAIYIFLLGGFCLFSQSRSAFTPQAFIVLKLIIPLFFFLITSNDRLLLSIYGTSWAIFLTSSTVLFTCYLSFYSKYDTDHYTITAITIPYQRLHRGILLFIIVFFITSFFNGDFNRTGLHGNSYAGLVKANPVTYMLKETSKLGALLLIFVGAFTHPAKNSKLLKLLIFGFIPIEYYNSISMLKSTSMTSYVNKLFQPLLYVIYFLFLKSNMWAQFRRLISGRLALSLLYSIAFMLVFVFLIVTLPYYIFDTPINFWVAKFLLRMDAVHLLNSNSIEGIQQQSYNVVTYLIHPFLKVLGIEAYNAPVGSYLLSKALNTDLSTTIGGPNIALPLLISLVHGAPDGTLSVQSLIILIFIGVLYGLVISHCHRVMVLKRYNSITSVFWAIFLFFAQTRLLTEPSAFGHSLFFFCFILLFFRIFIVKSVRYG